MGVREEETGNVVKRPAIVGEPWWLLSRLDGTAFCCHIASSWFDARRIGQALNEGEPVGVSGPILKPLAVPKVNEAGEPRDTHTEERSD